MRTTLVQEEGQVPDAAYRVYRAEPQRRRGWLYALLAALAIVAAVVGWQLYEVPRVAAVTPGPDAFVKNPDGSLVLEVRGLSGLSDVAVTLDGKDVSGGASQNGNMLTIATGDLSDGSHRVTFQARSSNLFRRKLTKEWRFTVDTQAPKLKLSRDLAKGFSNTDPAEFRGTTEAFATVSVVAGAVTAEGTADAAGVYSVSADLPPGAARVEITATDRAGNATAKALDVFVDAEPPVLKVTKISEIHKKPGISVRVKATDQLGVPTVKFVLDGEERELSGPTSRATFRAANLAQGKHVMIVTASDRGGNVVTNKQKFLIDSTEDFGKATLWRGARGKDVKELQSKLANAGVYSGRKTAVYDAATEKAVRKLQAKYGLEVDGIVGGNVLNALSGQIVIDLSELRLYLYRNGNLVKTYPVAAGQPAYPTPTGSYSIVTLQKNPTWLPPDSDWAKEAKPIPPGATNPLGTRWMGTSAPGIGIHGVPPSSDASIGTYASHGCIRMHNWDAVDLFDRIVIGMPVIIRP
jgi:L,D-transpeptidase ErfK/SrfK